MGISSIHFDALVTIFESLAELPWAPEDEEELQKNPDCPVEFPWMDLSTIISASSVCKFWREAMHATSVCWSTIVINLDGDEHELASEMIKIRFHRLKSRSQPLTIIIQNEYPGLCVEEFPTGLIPLIKECITSATHIFARFIRPDVAISLFSMLAQVPNLQTLTLWYMRDFEFRSLGRRYTVEVLRDLLPSTYLEHAPKLRSIYNRGVPFSNPTRPPIYLPMVKQLTIDNASSDVDPIDYHDSLVETFKNVASLTVLLTSASILMSPGPAVIFRNLQYLEMEGHALVAFFHFHHEIDSPNLHTFCFHLHQLNSGGYTSGLPGIAHQLQSSPGPLKRLIIEGFASEIPEASHVRCLQNVHIFDAIDCLEFRRCNFGFTKEWNVVWAYGVPPSWEEPFNQEQSKDVSYHEAANGEIVVDVEEIAFPPSHQVLPFKPPPYAMEFEAPFMPRLRQLVFDDCSFLHNEGAMGFADALAIRQTSIRAEKDGSNPLEVISFVGMEHEVATAMARRLQGGVLRDEVVLKCKIGQELSC